MREREEEEEEEEGKMNRREQKKAALCEKLDQLCSATNLDAVHVINLTVFDWTILKYPRIGASSRARNPSGGAGLNARPSGERPGRTSCKNATWNSLTCESIMHDYTTCGLSPCLGQDIQDRFLGAVEAFPEDIFQIQVTDIGRQKMYLHQRMCNWSQKKVEHLEMADQAHPVNAIDSRSSRLVSSSGRLSTTQRNGIEPKPSSFSCGAVTKGTSNDPPRSFDFLSIRK